MGKGDHDNYYNHCFHRSRISVSSSEPLLFPALWGDFKDARVRRELIFHEGVEGGALGGLVAVEVLDGRVALRPPKLKPHASDLITQTNKQINKVNKQSKQQG